MRKIIINNVDVMSEDEESSLKKILQGFIEFEELDDSIKRFNCPNCGEVMRIEEKNSLYNGEKYDKWVCEDCSHIILLDFRGAE